MPQNYKIYHNGTPVFLTTPEGARALGYTTDKQTHVAPYIGKKKMLKQFIDLLDKNGNIRAVVIYHDDLEALWRDYLACFRVIEAAGGFVLNEQNKLLVFYRRGSWDLPKGKIDPGETPEEAAIREVKEETGLKNLFLGDFLTYSYHVYPLKGDRILKITWWYHMRTTDTELIPQVEEDISEIAWVDPKNWLESGLEIYPNIQDLVRQGIGAL